MADFLSRLLERASGLAPVVQPIVPSAFATGAPPTGEDLAVAPMDGGREPAGSLHRSPRPDRTPGRTPVAESADIAGSLEPSPSRRSLPATARMDRALPVELPAAIPGPASPTHDGPPSSPLVHAASGPPGPAAPSQLAAMPSRREEMGAVAPTVPAAEERQPRPVERGSYATGMGSVVSAYPEEGFPSLQLRSSPPSPAIRVTIGRVEVRAVMPPAPAPAPPAARARPGPALPLEEYLKQRRGRAR